MRGCSEWASLGSSRRSSMCTSLSYTALASNPLNGNRYDGFPFASRDQNSHSRSISACWVQPTDEQRFLPALSFFETCARAHMSGQAQSVRRGGTAPSTRTADARTMLYSSWLYSVTSVCFERFSRCASLVPVALPAGSRACLPRIDGQERVLVARLVSTGWPSSR